jgi:hypothetical protein
MVDLFGLGVEIGLGEKVDEGNWFGWEEGYFQQMEVKFEEALPWEEGAGVLGDLDLVPEYRFDRLRCM